MVEGKSDYLSKEKSICFVSQSFLPYPGGVSSYLYSLSQKFIEEGDQIIEICLKTPETDRRENIDGIEVYRIPKRTPSKKLFSEYGRFKDTIYKSFHLLKTEEDFSDLMVSDFGSYFKFNRKIAQEVLDIYKERKFDVLNVHDFQVLLLGELLVKLNIPKVFTWHIPFFPEVDEYIKRWVASKINFYDKVIFSTPEYADSAIKAGVNEDKVIIRPPFVDTGMFSPPEEESENFRKKYNIPEEAHIILCVSRLDPIKGQEMLIEAIPKIKEKVKNFKVVFVGNGSLSGDVLKRREKEKKGVFKAVDKFDVEDDVVFTGYVPFHDIPAIYNASDIVVLPSKIEAFGLGVTEGMASGKPVVGTEVGGIKTQIIEGHNGFLMKPGDWRKLAERLIELLQDEGLREKMGKAGKSRVRENYSLDVAFEEYNSLFKEVIQPETEAMVFDLEGTLMRPGEKEISQTLKDTLVEVKEEDIKLILVSDKDLEFMKKFHEKNPFWDGIVAETGCVVYLPTASRTITVKEEESRLIIEKFKEHGIKPKYRRSSVYLPGGEREKAQKIIEEEGLNAHLQKNSTNSIVLPKGVSKKTGIFTCLKELEVEPEKSIYFGDAKNDIYTFELPGIKIAAKDADAELKEKADFVLERGYGTGIREFIKSRIL